MRIVTFGEIMLRLTPERHLRFTQADRFEAVYGGAEANVAVALAQMGEEAAFVTKLPQHGIGQAAADALRRFGADVRDIVRGGERIGIYFQERGAAQRPSQVLYDRKNSAFALSLPQEYDWERILQGASWLHCTGITPALGENAQKIAAQAMCAAKKKGITVSFDVNYRSNLWDAAQARRVMEALFGYVDVCISNEMQASELFGIRGETAEEAAQNMLSAYSFSHVAFTFRRTISAERNRIAGMLSTKEGCVWSPWYEMEMVDRIGGGDAFAAGLIYALLRRYDAHRAIGFAAAADCLKHSTEGDFCLISAQEAEALANGDGQGRLRR